MSLKPELFGKFILLDKIAAGGMAEVYRAKSQGLNGIGKIIALKRILPQYSSNAEFIDMFKNEAKITVNLAQANIAQIFEFGEQEHLFYLAMEFIDGRNLRQIISRCTKQQKSLTIEHCVFAIAQICTGLDYAHRCTDKNSGQPLNIIHRDMSPQNIMISFEGEVKMVDFGIAKAESRIESTRAGTLKGKFGYMSPEQAEGMDLDWRTDIFSTGIVLWELLTGERLFVANNEVNTIKKIREYQIPSPRKINPNINEELDRITMKALARDRNLRYQSASEMSRDLSRYLYKINPEFTPQDLSQFVKQLFRDEILEDRQKVSEFAKINYEKMRAAAGKQSENTNTSTHTETDTSQASNSAKSAPKNLILDSTTSAKDVNIKVDSTRLKQQLKAAKTQVGRRGWNAVSQPSYKHVKYNAALKWVSVGLLTCAVAIVGLLFLKNPSSVFEWSASLVNSIIAKKGMETSTGPEPLVIPPLTPTGSPAPAPIETGRLSIRTFPSGADVSIINEGSTTETQIASTPAEITLPMRKRIKIILRRDGYMPTAQDFIATRSVEDLTFTLEKAFYGYVTIEVRPANCDVYVDGRKLDAQAALKRVQILANRPVRITAINHFTNFKDEQIITVKPDNIKTVYLFPSKKGNN